MAGKKGPLGVILRTIGTLLLVCLLAAGGLYAYKKATFDYNGTYAKHTLVYAKDFGFCLLIEYHDEYKSGQSKGWASVNIPIKDLFGSKYHPSKDGNDAADSAEVYAAYKMNAVAGDNIVANTIVKALGSKQSTLSRQIGSYGKFFIITP